MNTYIEVEWAHGGIPTREDIVDAATSGKISRSDRRYHTLFTELEYDMDEVKRFLQRIIKWGHTSVLETIIFKFWISCSRAISHEHVRTRIASNTQKSTRYQKMDTDDISYNYVIPEMIKPEHLEDWVRDNVDNFEKYLKWKKRGYSHDICRKRLDGTFRTDIRFTVNARSLRNYLKQRLARNVDYEFRDIAKRMYLLIRDAGYDFLFNDIIPSYIFDEIDLKT